MIPASEEALIAACGGYCGHCGDYLAYVNDDKDLKKKIAVEIREQLNLDVLPEQVGCLGCWGEIHTAWCASCEVRGCCEQEDILCCALCDVFSCDKYDRQFGKNSKAREHSYRIREVGLDAWLNEVKSSRACE